MDLHMTKPKKPRKQIPKHILKRLGAAGGRKLGANNRKMRKLGLLKPTKLDADSPQFLKLQAKWYAKLESQGFNDLEWVKDGESNAQNSDYLKGTKLIKSKEHAESVLLYYQMLSNFLVHTKELNKLERSILEMHSDGKSLRLIFYKLKGRVPGKSIHHIHKRLVALRARAVLWNSENDLGLLRSRSLENEMIQKYLETAWSEDSTVFDSELLGGHKTKTEGKI